MHCVPLFQGGRKSEKSLMYYVALFFSYLDFLVCVVCVVGNHGGGGEAAEVTWGVNIFSACLAHCLITVSLKLSLFQFSIFARIENCEYQESTELSIGRRSDAV